MPKLSVTSKKILRSNIRLSSLITHKFYSENNFIIALRYTNEFIKMNEVKFDMPLDISSQVLNQKLLNQKILILMSFKYFVICFSSIFVLNLLIPVLNYFSHFFEIESLSTTTTSTTTSRFVFRQPMELPSVVQ